MTGCHPVTVQRDSEGSLKTVTVYRWPDMTSFDVKAQAVMATIRPSLAGETPDVCAWRIRNWAERHLDVRPMLDVMNKAEQEIAKLLQSKKACELLAQ